MAEDHEDIEFCDEATNLDAGVLNRFDAITFGRHQKIPSTAHSYQLADGHFTGGPIGSFSINAVADLELEELSPKHIQHKRHPSCRWRTAPAECGGILRSNPSQG